MLCHEVELHCYLDRSVVRLTSTQLGNSQASTVVGNAAHKGGQGEHTLHLLVPSQEIKPVRPSLHHIQLIDSVWSLPTYQNQQVQCSLLRSL